MVDEGALEDPRVDQSLALHVWQDLPVGTVSVATGPCWAAVDDLDLHGSRQVRTRSHAAPID